MVLTSHCNKTENNPYAKKVSKTFCENTNIKVAFTLFRFRNLFFSMHQVFTGKRCHSCHVGKIERQRSIRSTWRFTSFLTSWTKLKLPKFVWWKLFWFCWSCFFLILIKPVRNSTCGVVKTWYNYDLNILFLCSDWIHTENFPGRMRPVK